MKSSAGLILCRKAPGMAAEVLLVRKRHTYAYAEFVHGHYGRGAARSAALKGAGALLDEMTPDELLDVASLSFPLMWYKLWLTWDNREFYYKKLEKFRSAFGSGAALGAAARAARGRGELVWEPPKGRLEAGEAELSCAVREMQEEAGIPKRLYRIIPDSARHLSHVSGGVRYATVYHVAVVSAEDRRLGLEGRTSAEISDRRWYTRAAARDLNRGPQSKRMDGLIDAALRTARLFLAGRWPPTRAPRERRPRPAGDEKWQEVRRGRSRGRERDPSRDPIRDLSRDRGIPRIGTASPGSP